MGFLPRAVVSADERAGLLRILRVEGLRISRELALVYRKEKALTRAGQAFLEIATGRARPPQPMPARVQK
jgi:DNA-binding transcriptional LysR family regulator